MGYYLFQIISHEYRVKFRQNVPKMSFPCLIGPPKAFVKPFCAPNVPNISSYSLTGMYAHVLDAKCSTFGGIYIYIYIYIIIFILYIINLYYKYRI